MSIFGSIIVIGFYTTNTWLFIESVRIVSVTSSLFPTFDYCWISSDSFSWSSFASIMIGIWILIRHLDHWLVLSFTSCHTLFYFLTQCISSKILCSPCIYWYLTITSINDHKFVIFSLWSFDEVMFDNRHRKWKTPVSRKEEVKTININWS